MRTKTINLYQFEELTAKAKERARSWYREGHLHYEWWDCLYDDASSIGLKITEFDLGGRKQIKGYLTVSVQECCTRILAAHGASCETYKLADSWQAQSEQLAELLAARWGDEAEEVRETLEAEQEEHAAEFEQALLEEYFVFLDKEYDYLNSDEAVDESIMANGYEFDEDGDRA